MSDDAIRLQAAQFAEEMQRRGERLWAKRLRKAIHVVHEPLPCYAISHNLFWLRRDPLHRRPAA